MAGLFHPMQNGASINVDQIQKINPCLGGGAYWRIESYLDEE
jgi:hypothetical protein